MKPPSFPLLRRQLNPLGTRSLIHSTNTSAATQTCRKGLSAPPGQVPLLGQERAGQLLRLPCRLSHVRPLHPGPHSHRSVSPPSAHSLPIALGGPLGEGRGWMPLLHEAAAQRSPVPGVWSTGSTGTCQEAGSPRVGGRGWRRRPPWTSQAGASLRGSGERPRGQAVSAGRSGVAVRVPAPVSGEDHRAAASSVVLGSASPEDTLSGLSATLWAEDGVSVLPWTQIRRQARFLGS